MSHLHYRVPVSVVIPCYNRARAVQDAVASALVHAAHLGEILIVDDGSTDDTPQTLLRLARANPLLRIITQANRGVSAARNVGCRAARCEWIALLDSDDVWLANKFDAQWAALEHHPGARLSASRYWGGDPQAPQLKPKVKGDLNRIETHLLQHFISPSASLMATSLYHEVGGFDETMLSAGDTDFFLRALLRTRLAVVWEPTANLFKSKEGLSHRNRLRSALNQRNAVERVLASIANTADALAPGREKAILGRWSARVARAHLNNGDARSALAEIESHAECFRGSIADRFRGWRIVRRARRLLRKEQTGD